MRDEDPGADPTNHNAAGHSPLVPRAEPIRVTFYLFFPGGGIGRYTHELMLRMHKSDRVTADLACLPSYHFLAEASYPVWPELREIGHSSKWRRKARFLIGQVANPRRLCQHLKQTKADIVHFSNINHLSFPAWERALDATGAKIAATAHDVRRATGILNARFERRQLIRFYQRADALFVHSRAQASDLMDFASVPEAKVHVVPHGPYDYGSPSADREVLRKRYDIPAGKHVALAFGQIRDEKNLDLLLDVLPRYRDRLYLVIAGHGGAQGHRGIDSYQRQVERLGLQDSVRILYKYVPDEEVADLFEISDWVALNYSRRFTSQSGVLNVAANYRRPSVVSATATLDETIQQCDVAVTVEPDDAESLAEGIGRMHDRIERGHQHDFEGYAEQFGWDMNTSRTIDVYQGLLRGQSVSAAETKGKSGR